MHAPSLLLAIVATTMPLATGWPRPAAAAEPPAAAPLLLSGAITGANVTVAGTVGSPTISFTFKAPAILASWAFTFTSLHGQTKTMAEATVQYPGIYPGHEAPAGTAGTIVYSEEDQPFSLYAEAGTWTLTAAVLTDVAGQQTSYTAAQLAALFPSVTLTVTNAGIQDLAAPTVTAGKLLNKTVSLSSPLPYLGAQVTIGASVSGADLGEFFLTTPAGAPYMSGTAGPLPVKKGPYQFGAGFDASQPTGVWTIAGYEVCNIPGNCVLDMNAADVKALFGTTNFTVTP